MRGELTRDVPQIQRWSRLTTAAFRFCVVYFGLYCFATQVIGGLILFPGWSFPSLGMIWPMREITLWFAAHVFRLMPPLIYTGNSGDTAFHWIQTFWLLIAATLGAAVWSQFDRARRWDAAVYKWFRLFLRFGLAGQMFYFGMAKVIPTQFPPPSLVTLVEPVGHLSPTDLLWTFVGSSGGYQMFTGWAEVLGGILLVVPRTTALGAIIAFADMLQVLAFNMAYDIGLKLISLHLILMAIVLLAPDFARLADVLLFDRATGPSSHAPLFRTPRANRRALAAQILFGGYLMVMFTHLALNFWSGPGGPGAPKSLLYGIWDVDRLSVDGQLRSPLLNDYDRRWRRIIFDAPDRMIFQRLDDSFVHYGASIDAGGHRIALRKGDSSTWAATLIAERRTAEHLVLDGEMDGHAIHVELQRVDLDVFRLLNNGFRWIRPPDPYGG
jgi:uncharacterized membrane protein YphA (DoxX/SURF4 family)